MPERRQRDRREQQHIVGLMTLALRTLDDAPREPVASGVAIVRARRAPLVGRAGARPAAEAAAPPTEARPDRARAREHRAAGDARAPLRRCAGGSAPGLWLRVAAGAAVGRSPRRGLLRTVARSRAPLVAPREAQRLAHRSPAARRDSASSTRTAALKAAPRAS